VVRGPIAVRDYSVLFYAECKLFPGPALAKICLEPQTHAPDGGAAQRQYDALVRVHRAMKAVREFSVPQPYLILPELALLAMEWIPGVNLGKTLFSWRSRADEARAYVARSAGWLRAFHACGRLPAGRLDVETRIPILEDIARRAVPDDAFRVGVEQLRRSAHAAGIVELSRAWIHGDFSPDNVILSGSRTIGIDIHIQHQNTVVYDLAPFLNHLALGLYEPAGWLLARAHDELRKTFLATYFEGEQNGVDAPLAWVQLYMALQQWRSARQRAGHPLRRRFLDFEYRQLTSYLARRLAQ
jgi:tRNA A-37 threonylcarbamoyl transferase component Bud32